MTGAAKIDLKQFVSGKNIFTVTRCEISGSGFEVVRTHREPVHLDAPPLANPVGWEVQLPHQCDEWVISNAHDAHTALAELDAFIAEAQQARAKLAEIAEEAA